MDPASKLAELRARAARVFLDVCQELPAARDPSTSIDECVEVLGHRGEPLLGAVVQLALQPAALRVGGLDDAPA